MRWYRSPNDPPVNLRKLNRAIAADLPERKSGPAAWREMRATFRRQQVEPDYQYDTPLPSSAAFSPTSGNRRGGTDQNELLASLSDLAPSAITE